MNNNVAFMYPLMGYSPSQVKRMKANPDDGWEMPVDLNTFRRYRAREKANREARRTYMERPRDYGGLVVRTVSKAKNAEN